MDIQSVWGNNFNAWRVSYEERLRREEEQEQAKQRQIMELLPLPRRAAPCLWEDLASVLSRTARIMGYARPQWLLHPEAVRHGIDQDALPVLHRRIDSLLLSRLLLLEEEQLYALTLHRFAARFTQPRHSAPSVPTQPNDRRSSGRPILDERDCSFFLPRRNMQVCPLCLDEGEGYDRLYWRCDLLLLCPRHCVFLVSRCPACRAPIPALRPQSTTCPSCGKGDYRSTVLTPQVEEETWLRASHCLLLNHLGVEPAEAGTVIGSPTPLWLLDSWDFFWLLREFTSIFDFDAARGKVLPFLTQTLSLQDLVARVSACRGAPRAVGSKVSLHYLLAGWPAHFLAFLDRVQRIIQEEYHYPAESALVLNWASAMVKGNYWCSRTYNGDTVPCMRQFFGTYKEYFDRLPAAEGVEQRQNEPLVLSWYLQPVTAEHAVEPKPWESLSSVLRRVARNVGYSRPELLMHSDEEPPAWFFPKDITVLRHGNESRWLARQLHLDEETLHRLTLHRFATALEPLLSTHHRLETDPFGLGEPPLLSHETVRRFCVPPETVQLCPACLEEEECYEPLYWKIRYALVCPRHRIFLIDRCPSCRRLIPPLLHSEDTLCVHCRREDYRAAPRVAVPTHSFLYAGQASILHFLGIDDSSWGEVLSLFAESPIQQVESWQYFHLLDRFGMLVPLLLSSNMLRAFNNEIDIQQELSWSQLRGKSQVAKHVTLFHIAFASYPQFLERATSFLHGPHRSDAASEETIRLKQPERLAHEATAGPYVRYSSLLHDLDVLITATQMQTHRRREDACIYPHLLHGE
ncbi:MAG: TniQ family protein [Ktedonobacteraceae bacterium]